MSEQVRRLGGRTVLITGASSGIGERFARCVAGEGAAVVLGARRIDRLTKLRDEIITAGGRALAVPLADRCVQVMGGTGVSGDTIVEQVFREVRAFRNYDGPTEVHKWSLAKKIKRDWTSLKL